MGVALRLKNTKIDRLVMLFSVDWFLEHWAEIGLNVDDRKKRECVRDRCREIVRAVIDGASEYWLVNFSEQRIATTFQQFRILLDKCRLSEEAIRRMNLIITGGCQEDEPRLARILTSITMTLLQNNIDGTHPLGGALASRLRSTWNRTEIATADFEELSRRSNSKWDQYIRNLTPDLPCYLSDYVNAELTVEDRFKRFWLSIRAELPEAETKSLAALYVEAVRLQPGEEISLPDWMAISK
jgi:hypothetical protein